MEKIKCWNCFIEKGWLYGKISTWAAVGRPWPSWSLLGRCCSHSKHVWIDVSSICVLLIGNFAIRAIGLWTWGKLMKVVPACNPFPDIPNEHDFDLCDGDDTINTGLPGHSVADIPTKHTASATSRRFTAVENQPKASVHHLVVLLMSISSRKMVLLMMMLILVADSPLPTPLLLHYEGWPM